MLTDAAQRSARITGVLFLITFVTSIAALALFQPVLDDPAGYIAGGGADKRIYLAAFLELLLIIANIGTAVVPFPTLRRQDESLALGYVTARIVECVFILIGILAVLAVVTLRSDAGADAASLGGYATSLAAIKDWTFLLGPGFIVGIGNGLILGYLMYTSALVPRKMALLGLIGGPLIILSGIAVLFGLIDAGSPVQGIATIPEFLWELSLGIYLTVKGFRPSAPILSGEALAPPERLAARGQTSSTLAGGVIEHEPGGVSDAARPGSRTVAVASQHEEVGARRGGDHLVLAVTAQCHLLGAAAEQRRGIRQERTGRFLGDRPQVLRRTLRAAAAAEQARAGAVRKGLGVAIGDVQDRHLGSGGHELRRGGDRRLPAVLGDPHEGSHVR